MPSKKLSSIMEAYLASAQVPSEPPVKPSPASAPVVPMNRWVLEDKKRLRKTYTFDSVSQRNDFARFVLSFEEAAHHAGELYVIDQTVTVRIWTKDNDSLTELDKEFARVVDTLYKDIICPLPSVYLHNTVG